MKKMIVECNECGYSDEASDSEDLHDKLIELEDCPDCKTERSVDLMRGTSGGKT